MLNKAVLKNTLRQKATWLLLALGLFPLITIITELLGSDLFRIDGLPDTVSCFSFIQVFSRSMNGMIIPSIIMAFISASLFSEEIETGRLSFFKDQDRKKVMYAKIRSLVIVYVIYFITLVVSSTIAYYTLYSLGKMPMLSGEFFGSNRSDLLSDIGLYVGLLADAFSVLLLTVAISVKASTGYTILAAILINLLSQLAGLAKELTYIVPSGYLTALKTQPFAVQLTVVVALALVYIVLGNYLTYKNYAKAEY